MLRALLTAGCAATALLTAGAAAAQNTVASIRNLASAAPADSALSAPAGFEITADKGDSKASIAFARQVSTVKGSVAEFNVTGVKFTAAVDDDSEATFLSLKGLPGATTASVSFSQTRAHGRDLPANEGRAGEICADALEIERRKLGVAEISSMCDSEKVATYAPGSLAEFQAATWAPSSWVTIWGVSAEAGVHDFDFIDGTSLAQRSDRKSVWSARGFVAWHKVDSPSFFIVSAELAEDYQAADEQTLCDNTGGPILTCVTGPVGAPVKVRREVASLEYRRRISSSLAASLSVSRDFGNDVTAVDLPIFMIRDKDDGLTGGVRFGWNSEQDEVAASVFVAKAFSLYGR